MTQLSKVTFWNKTPNKGSDSKIYTCQIKKPTMKAIHWYQLNTNKTLQYTLIIKAFNDPAESFNACEFPDSRRFLVTGSYQLGPGLWQVEVGS